MARIVVHLRPDGVVPGTTGVTDLYTAAADEVLFFDVVNMSGASADVRMWISPDGAAVNNKDRIVAKNGLPNGEAIPRLGPHPVKAGDVVRVQTSQVGQDGVNFRYDGTFEEEEQP